MLSRTLLLPLILWTTTAQAFFPWFPPAVCADDNELCKPQAQVVTGPGVVQEERSLPAKVVADGLSFKIGRRRSISRAERSEPLTTKVERAARRLAKKHAAFQATAGLEHGLQDRSDPRPVNTPTATADSVLVKRTNTYSIVQAATPTATNAVGIDQDGTDFTYFIQATIGSADQNMLMLLDTGAGTTWVMGTGCQSAACTMHTTFGPSDSKTLQTSNETFSIAYGSGAVAGTLASDTIDVASLSMTMSFGLANTTSSDFTYFAFDGILGLSLSQGVTDNFLQVVKKNKLLSANIFGVSLWREADGSQNTGEIIFGAVDPTKYTGSISYTSVPSSTGGDWAIAMGDIGYNGGKAGITNRLAYIDTGTTYVFGPSSDVASLHAQIPGAYSSDGGVTYTVPCTSDKPLTVYFSGVAYNISPEDWLSSPDDSGNCTSNVYGHAVVADAWLLGDLFIKNVYAVFDVDQTRIGFASKPALSRTPTKTATTPGVTTAAGVSSGSVTSVTPDASSGNSATVLPGLGGHETAATALPESTSIPKPTAVSPAEHLERNAYVSILCIVVAIAVAV